MQLLFYVLSFLFFLGLQAKLYTQTDTGPKVIVIDPGHGGRDSGAIGINVVKEKEIVLSIAKKLENINSKLLNDQFEIYLTRYSDTLISLEDRTRLTRSINADVFISLHCNQARNPNARGVEIYVNTEKGIHSDASILLAYRVQRKMKTLLGFKSRGVKFGNFQVLRETSNICPSVLVEFGFLSNIDEVNFLRNTKTHSSIALVILQSINKMYRL